MLRNKIGRIFNTNTCFFPFCFLLFFEKSHSPCRKKKIFENPNTKNKILDGFSTQKRAIFGRIFNSTAYIYNRRKRRRRMERGKMRRRIETKKRRSKTSRRKRRWRKRRKIGAGGGDFRTSEVGKPFFVFKNMFFGIQKVFFVLLIHDRADVYARYVFRDFSLCSCFSQGLFCSSFFLGLPTSVRNIEFFLLFKFIIFYVFETRPQRTLPQSKTHGRS